MCGISVQYLRRVVDAGIIPCIRDGKQRRFNPDAVKNVLAQFARLPQEQQEARLSAKPPQKPKKTILGMGSGKEESVREKKG